MGERSSRPLLTADKKNTRKKSEKTTTNSFESNRSHFGVGGKGRKILAQKARNIGNRNVTEARCCLSARSETKCLSARSETKSLSARSERKKLRAGDSWERVKVTIRVRPYTKAEAAREVGIPLIKANAQMKSVTVRRKGGTVDSMEFKFDDVLLSAANQADVYNRAAQAIVLDVLDGYNGTILAYGQTGAGKTYTLSAMVIDKYGVQTAEGMVPRSAADIFARVAEDKDHEYHVSMSYIQIYMEIIQDLLRPENLNLQIREGEDGNIFVAGVEEIEVNSVEDVVRLMMLGDSNRFKAFTKMNAHSSRSHAIVILMVEKKALHPFLRRNDITPRKRILKGSGLSEK